MDGWTEAYLYDSDHSDIESDDPGDVGNSLEMGIATEYSGVIPESIFNDGCPLFGDELDDIVGNVPTKRKNGNCFDKEMKKQSVDGNDIVRQGYVSDSDEPNDLIEAYTPKKPLDDFCAIPY